MLDHHVAVTVSGINERSLTRDSAGGALGTAPFDKEKVRSRGWHKEAIEILADWVFEKGYR